MRAAFCPRREFVPPLVDVTCWSFFFFWLVDRIEFLVKRCVVDKTPRLLFRNVTPFFFFFFLAPGIVRFLFVETIDDCVDNRVMVCTRYIFFFLVNLYTRCAQCIRKNTALEDRSWSWYTKMSSKHFIDRKFLYSNLSFFISPRIDSPKLYTSMY